MKSTVATGSTRFGPPARGCSSRRALSLSVSNGRPSRRRDLRAGLIGASVGTLAWFAPDLVGGGDPITQRTLAGAETLALLPVVFLVRLALDAVSYAAGAPGGLFAPMLVLGAQLGLLFGLLCRIAFPDLNIQPEGFAVVGMAAFFIGVGQVGPASCGILASDWIVAGKTALASSPQLWRSENVSLFRPHPDTAGGAHGTPGGLLSSWPATSAPG